MMQNEKRPLTADEIELQQANKRAKLEGGGGGGLDALASASSVGDDDDSDGDAKPGAPMSKARENRLEQNRKAARESRRRKKLMIEELQRSVIFFSKANGTLKMQNDEFTRRLMDAQVRVAAVESGKDQNQPTVMTNTMQQQQQPQEALKQPEEQNKPPPQFLNEQVQAQAVATQAMYESQGFPAGAARAAAQAMNASTGGNATNTPNNVTPQMQTGPNGLPQMQPGATMQAMAAFQQAAAAAMQAAMGMNPTAAANPQQAYADAMNAFAQQAGAQAQFAAQHHQSMPQGAFMGFPQGMTMPMQWAQQTGAPTSKPPPLMQQQPPQMQVQGQAQTTL